MKLLYNAYIYTQDPSHPTESAIVIDRERIVAVGEANNLLPQYPNAEKQNMNGRVILPGLTDAHLHLKHYSFSLQKIDCETDTKEECLRRVEERARKAKPGEWILGHGWNQNVWGNWPTASELDAIFDRSDSFMALQQLHKQGKLKLRVLKNLPVELLDQAYELGLGTGFGDDWLRIGSVKAFMDGALGPHTAAMFQPYIGEEDNRGILNMDGEELFEYGRKAAEVGLAMTVHAIGDRANHEVLNAYEQLRNYEKENNLPALRHRIEHVQVVHPDDAARLGKMNIIASMQPIHATSDMLMADAFWGERSRLAYAMKTQLDHGARLALGSDAPVESPNPFWGLHAAVTRRRANGSPSADGWYPEQKLSMAEALEGYTIGPAYAANMENRLGRLAPGYLADLIVLDASQDPFTCNADDLLTMQSSATMVGGEWVYTSIAEAGI